jgi:hypothetical protein
MKKYYKRKWDETRGDEFDSWGASMWYFEIGEDKYITRQIEIYENGNRLKYHNDKRFDDYGGLGTGPLDVIEFEAFEIDKDEFEMEWRKSIPKKEHKEIIDLISEYLSNNYDQRFGQTLFNLGINGFANKMNPEKENYKMRDIHGDSDKDILHRIKNQLERFEEQRKKNKTEN